jgi:hypothetical protein
MGEPLMEALLDFKVFFTNRQYDVQFGRIDIESMDWFPGGTTPSCTASPAWVSH